MHDDLLDAYASIEWAESQLDTLRARIGAWLNDFPDVVCADKNPQTGEEVWQIYQRFELHGVTHLRLKIVPNKNGSGTATLKLRPEPVREPLPPPKVYALRSKGRYRRQCG
jgi:hypothetical protein